MNNFLKKYRFQAIICAVILLLSVIAIIWFVSSSKDDDDQVDAATTVLLDTGDATMTLDEGIFLAKNKQAYYEAYYLSDGYKINWDAEYEDGRPFGDVVLEESLEFVKEIFLFSEYAKSKGYTLSESDLSSIKTDVSTFLSDSSDNVINATHANEDLLTRVYTRTVYYNMICDEIYDQADLTIDEDEIRQCLVSIIELSPKYFDSPDETAEAIMNRVNNGEIITEVAKKYKVTAQKGNVSIGSMDGSALEKLCLNLKNGECKITEIKGTYFVAYCYLENDEEATDIAKELKLEELKDEARAAFCQELMKDMPISVNMDAWNTINYDQAIFTEKDIATLEEAIS